jgi:hypothetical protein
MLTILAYATAVLAITAVVLLVVGILGVIASFCIKNRALRNLVEETGTLCVASGSLTWFSAMTIIHLVSAVLSIVTVPVTIFAFLGNLIFVALCGFIMLSDAKWVSDIAPQWKAALVTWKQSKTHDWNTGFQAA